VVAVIAMRTDVEEVLVATMSIVAMILTTAGVREPVSTDGATVAASTVVITAETMVVATTVTTGTTAAVSTAMLRVVVRIVILVAKLVAKLVENLVEKLVVKLAAKTVVRIVERIVAPTMIVMLTLPTTNRLLLASLVMRIVLARTRAVVRKDTVLGR
jgi:hypothetical protein